MKRTIMLICAISLLMCLLAPATSLAASSVVVISETVSIRPTMDTSADAIAVAHNGEMLTVVDEAANWYLIRFDDDAHGAHGQGYVLKRFVIADPAHVTAPGRVYVYAMPDERAKTVGEVEAGTSLVVIGEWGAFWAVNLRTASGFVRKADVDYNGISNEWPAQPTAAPTIPAPPVTGTTYILVRDSSLREAPSASAAISGVMITGSEVVIGRIQDGYGQDIDNGLWLSMDDLMIPVPIETSGPGAFRYLVSSDNTPVYGEPDESAPIVDSLAKDTLVTVTRTEKGMGLVSYGRQRGWVLMRDLQSLAR